MSKLTKEERIEKAKNVALATGALVAVGAVGFIAGKKKGINILKKGVRSGAIHGINIGMLTILNKEHKGMESGEAMNTAYNEIMGNLMELDIDKDQRELLSEIYIEPIGEAVDKIIERRWQSEQQD